MRAYLIHRILQIIPTLFIISILLFMGINALPGNPLAHLLDPFDPTAPNIDDINYRLEQLGYNRPIHVRYAIWLKETLAGNLGFSGYFNRPVGTIIAARIPATITLTFTAMLLSIILAIPMGVLAAVRKHTFWDYLLSALALLGMSVPVFFLGTVLMKVFAFDLRMFPLSGMVTAGYHHANILDYYWDVALHLVLPVTALAAAGTATYMRYIRACMLEVLGEDYVRTARAKGLSERKVIYKHALRNSLTPVITQLGLSLPVLFSGALLVEMVFTWPGLGVLNLQALRYKDHIMIIGISMVTAVMILLGNLLADIAYAVVDPRIRYN